MRGPGDFAPVEYEASEEEQARDRCSECGSWGPCLDTCPVAVEQAERDAADDGAAVCS